MNLTYTEHFGQSRLRFASRSVALTYFGNLFSGKFRGTILLAWAWSVAAFGHHVCDIGGLCSKEHMRWIHAANHIAIVADAHTVGDWTISQFPREAMNGNRFAVGVPEVAMIGSVCSAEADRLFSLPHPAPIAFLDFGPESAGCSAISVVAFGSGERASAMTAYNELSHDVTLLVRVASG